MLERTDSLQAEQLLQLHRLGRSPSAVVSGTGTSAMALLGTDSVLRYYVKKREQALFHSTLES